MGWKIALAIAVALPAIVLRLAGVHLPPPAIVGITGAAVVSAAVLLGWTAEAAQVDVSASIATALLALITVLPEYSVDIYFAWISGRVPEYTHYTVANMTGGNRLLVGLGWPLVIFAYARVGKMPLRLGAGARAELVPLLLASLYAFRFPLAGALSLVDTIVLFAIFALYLVWIARLPKEEIELHGVAARLGALARWRRRGVVMLLFAFSAAVVLLAAEPFADGLVDTGDQLRIDKFLLVQWFAPLASEAPELIVAALLAWRGRGRMAMTTLLSSKVNQWTLLVGSLPLAHWIGGGSTSFALDARQSEEIVLTAAQSLLGFAVVLDLTLDRREAALLLGLFILPFPFPQAAARIAVAILYLAIAVFLVARTRVRRHSPSH